MICIVLLLWASAAFAAEVLHLPGWDGPLLSRHFAGHITVDTKHHRNLFYYLVESESQPMRSPVLLWLNGGPGCSSLIGMFTENGPFMPLNSSAAPRLVRNVGRWNKFANVLFVESPAGVGFSYSLNKTDYVTGDDRTSEDMFVFLEKFFFAHPQYAVLPLFISGESYAGHYVPQLAQRILHSAGQMRTNFRGFLVGNAWTHPKLDNTGRVEFWYSHGLISKKTRDDFFKFCDFEHIFTSLASVNYDPVECEKAQKKARSEMGNIDLYSIYGDTCEAPGVDATSRRGEAQWDRFTALPVPPTRRVGPSPPPAKGTVGYFPPVDPCIDRYLTQYLNRKDVQRTIHAELRDGKPWAMCSSLVDYSETDFFRSVLPVYEDILAHAQGKLRMLIYTGDTDGVVPLTGTLLWMDELHLTETVPWRPWHIDAGEVGGYVIQYAKNITLVTVRGAGHMVRRASLFAAATNPTVIG